MDSLRIVDHGRPLESFAAPDPVAGPGEVVVRVEAAGICRSDVHYRAGARPVPSLPLVPGHEVAGVVSAVGAGVSAPAAGDRVCLHYLISCGRCRQCRRGSEQFCAEGAMLGFDRSGGYSEAIVVPAVNAFPIPDEVSTDAAAIMMCSTATAFHALRRGRLQRGERVAVFGTGGLGISAVELSRALGAFEVYAVDLNPVKLEAAARRGAVPVDASDGDPVGAIRSMTDGGVDVALELVGLAATMRQAVDSLAPSGRAVAVGITVESFELDSFRDLVVPEAEVIGSADHLASEIATLLEMAQHGVIDLDGIVTSSVPLDAIAVNDAMDRLEAFGDDVRTVIRPAT